MQSTLPAHLSPASATPFHRTSAGRIALVVAASLFVAACAHLSVPLPFTLVPLTLQPFAVILVGLLLGPVAGFSALALYLAEGAAGLPVFTPQGPGGIAQLLGPTGGFLFSYPLAAALAGALARPRARFASACLAGTAAAALIYTFGAAWFSHWHHLGTHATLTLAVLPFLPGELIKILAAAGIFSALNRTASSPEGPTLP